MASLGIDPVFRVVAELLDGPATDQASPESAR